MQGARYYPTVELARRAAELTATELDPVIREALLIVSQRLFIYSCEVSTHACKCVEF